jgi:hypothetical protein
VCGIYLRNHLFLHLGKVDSKVKTLIRTPDMPDGIRQARLTWVAETLRNKLLELPTAVVSVRTEFLRKVKR